MGIVGVILIVPPAFIFPIILVQSSTPSPNPECAILIFIDYSDHVGTQTVGIVRVVLVMDKTRVLLIRSFGFGL